MKSFTLPVNSRTKKYEPNEYVRISATAPEGYKIVAEFTNFKLEGNSSKNQLPLDRSGSESLGLSLSISCNQSIHDGPG